MIFLPISWEKEVQDYGFHLKKMRGSKDCGFRLEKIQGVE